MTHAVLIEVRLDPDSDREHRHSILSQFAIPEARGLPGFEKGLWLNNGSGTGTCIVVFDTEEHARAGIIRLTPAGGPPVLRSDVHEVEFEV